MRKAIGIDLGRSPVIGILSDIDGRIMDRYEIEIVRDAPLEYVAEDIKKLIRKLRHVEVRGVGIGTPGWIDQERGICHFSPNFPKWKEVDIITPFRDEFGIPVFALNDVNAATLGEMHYGVGVEMKSETPVYLTVSEGFLFDPGKREKKRRIKSLILIAVGVGIGGGIVINNELVVGNNYGAGEIGHITIEPDGPPCKCGNNGCLESLASLIAIRRGIEEGMKRGWKTSLSEHIDKAEDVNFRILMECAKVGDDLTMKILSIVGKYLGMGIAVVANMFDPEMIVIGGDIVPILDTLRPFIVKELKNRVKMIPYNRINYVPARLDELSGAYGAAAHVFRMLYDFGG